MTSNKNTKNTKSALLASSLSVVLCVIMLVGTTFAWFTDSVTGGNNIITAGDLKISATVYDLEDYNLDPFGDKELKGDVLQNITYAFMEKGDPDGGIALTFDSEKGKNFENNVDFMGDNLFEPGKTYVKMIRVKNEGSLAAKLKLQFDVKDGGLQDALWFAISSYPDQIDKTPMSQLNEKLEDFEATAFQTAGKEGHVDIIFAYGMDEDAGNDFQGKSFEATLKLFATQHTLEKDSFGIDYDKDAQ